MVEDKIGRKPIVDKICELVDSLKKDQSICLAINGAWGSGKSFVLQMIEEQLLKKQEYVIVKYDAWNNSFYSDPLIAILSCVIDGIDDKLYLVEQYERKIKHAAKTSVNTLARISSKIQRLKDVVSGIKEIIHNFHNPIDLKATSDFRTYQTLLRDTKEVLNEITQKGEYREKQTKLIVFVDEIDRCLPDEQLKILERLHHLFDIKNCAVLVAMNQICIAQTVNRIYGINGYEYLRKFFDLTFKLETSADQYFGSLLEDFSKNFEKLYPNVNDFIGALRAAYQCLLYGETRSLEKIDNREITRYFDGINNICNDFGWNRLTPHYIFFILIGLFIRKNIAHAFLNETEIHNNQNFINPSEVGKNDLIYSDSEMPYYDYLSQIIGVDRKHLPEQIGYLYRWNPNPIPQLSWCFNEIVYYSVDKEFVYNEMRLFYHQPTVTKECCQELRRLVIHYGGEPANAADEG